MTDEQELERQRALARLAEKHEAYLSLFGPPGKPTPYGAVVLADLDAFCTTFRESVHFDAHQRMDPYTTIYRDGKKAVALRIRQMLEWSEHGSSSDSPDNG